MGASSHRGVGQLAAGVEGGDGDDIGGEEAGRRGSSGECVEWRGQGGDGRRRIRGDAGLQATVVAHDDDERVRLGDEWKTERIGGRGVRWVAPVNGETAGTSRGVGRRVPDPDPEWGGGERSGVGGVGG